MFADDDMKGSQSTVGSSRVEPSKPKQDLGSPQSTDKTRLLDEVEGDNLYESQVSHFIVAIFVKHVLSRVNSLHM